MTKPKPQNFTIPLHIYPFDVMFSIDESDDKLSKRINEIEECSTIPNMIKDMSLDTAKGITYSLPRGSSIIRLQSDDRLGEFESTLSHEILHAVTYTLTFVGMKLDDSSVEAFCYLQGYLIKEFYKNFKQ